ncbi:MAG: ABC transporter substrate-binding protein [Clostridiales bacterium]|nr:ABC transporter substrate-binding protein [Clostridiales bacterium]
MKTKRILSLILVSILTITIVLTGCQPNDGTSAAAKNYERIVCGSVASTEIITALGLGDKLVAIDNFAFDVEGIPEDVTMMDFYVPNPEGVLACEPDLFITFDYEQNVESYKSVEDAGVDVLYVSSSSDSVDDVAADIRYLAEALGKKADGEKLAKDMLNKVDALKKKAEKVKEKKTVYFEISPAPSIFSVGSGTFINDMIEIIGAENVFSDSEGYPEISTEAIIERDPDVIITNVNYIPDADKEIIARDGFDELRAVKNGDVYIVDANATSRPTQNVVKAIEQIGKAVYPEIYG